MITSPLDNQRRSCLIIVGGLLIILVLAAVARIVFFPGGNASSTSHPSDTPTSVSAPPGPGIGTINKPNNEHIGLSDGSYAFDVGTDRIDASLKTQAATKLANGDKIGATSLWNLAVGRSGNDTSDAEALIYLEDQHVLASGSPYITLVVGTMLTGSASNISTGRDDLQGAYVAQKEYNDGLKLRGGKLVRLLVANAGSKSDYVTDVAAQIIQAAKQDSTIVGVVGWPFSAYAQKVTPVLAAAHIPMVSPSASADVFTRISPYFFRVVPSNNSQAVAGAKYAELQLNAHRVALFVDSNNSYSSSLAADFKNQFLADGYQIVDTETYTVGDKANLPARLTSALNFSPDLIYFSGYADDLAVLLINLPTSLPNLQIMGGDALYELGGYPSSARLGFSRLRFTAFAYPDEWSIMKMGGDQPFFSEYSAAFNPAGADHSAKPYGYTRADNHTILAYDAMHALLQGCQNVLLANNTLTPDALRNGLSQINGANAIQGLSGQIAFGSDGDPINKAIVILSVDSEGHIQLLQENVKGCFELGKC